MLNDISDEYSDEFRNFENFFLYKGGKGSEREGTGGNGSDWE